MRITTASRVLLLLSLAIPHAAAQDQLPGSPDNGVQQGSDHIEHDPRTMTGMQFDQTGMVMNANATELPRDCDEIAASHEFTVTVGRRWAEPFPGTVFGMSEHEFRVEPCSLVTVTLVNEDQVRHQWMLHGLPRYLYPQGMFHLEAAGGETRSGTFIVPSDNQTYLVHCDMTQHMEKGMKAQLVVGSGSGDLWSIPGVSRDFRDSRQVTMLDLFLVTSMAVMSFLVLVFLGRSQTRG